MLVDYHTHTSNSDGSDTPGELVAKALNKGLSVLAITDHDTIDGLAAVPGAHPRLRLVPGVELSAEYTPGTMHIVGLNIDVHNSRLNERLETLRRERLNRTPRILERLNGLGMHVTEEEVRKKAGGASVSRNHIASVLMDKGYVSERQEAFDRFLKKGASAYMPRVRLSPRECVETIVAAGGLAVLAHPNQLLVSCETLRNIVRELVSFGLGGIETVSSHHTLEESGMFVRIADEFHLACSTGSDYHGTVKPGIQLGMEGGEIGF